MASSKKQKHYFPKEIITNVLARLPREDLVSARLISRETYNSLSSMHFNNLTNPNLRRTALMVSGNDFFVPEHLNPPSDTFIINVKPFTPPPLLRDSPKRNPNGSISENIKFHGSFMGLVCLSLNECRYVVWNPNTGGCLEFPKLEDSSSIELFSGIGSFENEIEIVRVGVGQEGKADAGVPILLHRLSTVSGEWTLLGELGLFLGPNPTYVGVANNQLAWCYPEINPISLSAYDFGTRSLIFLPDPPVFAPSPSRSREIDWRSCALKLFVIDGKICALGEDDYLGVQYIWSLVGRWEKFEVLGAFSLPDNFGVANRLIASTPGFRNILIESDESRVHLLHPFAGLESGEGLGELSVTMLDHKDTDSDAEEVDGIDDVFTFDELASIEFHPSVFWPWPLLPKLALKHMEVSEFNDTLLSIQLSLSATKLLDLDIVSKSGPMAVVYMEKHDGNLEELGRTEVIPNDLNPSWIGKIPLAYQFEIIQSLVIHIYDVDPQYHNIDVKALNLQRQDFIGEANCALSEIFTKRDRTLTLKLHNEKWKGGTKDVGMLHVHAEETVTSRNAVEIVFRCSHLSDVDLLSKSDPFLRICGKVESSAPIPICKTEVVNNNLNPTWRPVCLTTQQFTSKENPLIIECFDFNSNGNHTLIGNLQTSISALQTLHREKNGINFVKAHHGHEKVLKGQLHVDEFHEKEMFSFLDYISSGFELNLMVAVDFTASNGYPWNPKSLHYNDASGCLNAYQRAIMEVGEVIQLYNSDKRCSAWGFGGRAPGGSVSHCFNLNGSPYDNEVKVKGIQGIMAAYNSALGRFSLHEPTLFGNVINKAAEIAGQSLRQNASKYYILLIITGGVATDLQETINSLVKASDLPLSILIVGVGSADFTQMEILNADTGRRLESSTGRIATRDIVQFFPIRKVQAGQKSMVQSLLEELPEQFLSYMRSRDLKPLTVHVMPDYNRPPQVI